MHVHLSHETCLEVILLRGRGGEVRYLAEHVIAEKGVHYGQLMTVPVTLCAGRHSHGGRRPHYAQNHTRVRGA